MQEGQVAEVRSSRPVAELRVEAASYGVTNRPASLSPQNPRPASLPRFARSSARDLASVSPVGLRVQAIDQYTKLLANVQVLPRSRRLQQTQKMKAVLGPGMVVRVCVLVFVCVFGRACRCNDSLETCGFLRASCEEHPQTQHVCNSHPGLKH